MSDHTSSVSSNVMSGEDNNTAANRYPRETSKPPTSIEEAFTAALASIESPELQRLTYERLMECAPEIVEVVARGEMLRLLPSHIRSRVFEMIPLKDRLQTLETISGGSEEPELRRHLQTDFRLAVLDSCATITDIQELPASSSELQKVFNFEPKDEDFDPFDIYLEVADLKFCDGLSDDKLNVFKIVDFVNRFPNITRFVKFKPFPQALMEQKPFLRDWEPGMPFSLAGLHSLGIAMARNTGRFIERVTINFPIDCGFPMALMGALQVEEMEYLVLRVKTSDLAWLEDPGNCERHRMTVKNLYIRLEMETSQGENVSEEDEWNGTRKLPSNIDILFSAIHEMMNVEHIESFRLEVVEVNSAEHAVILVPEIRHWTSLKDFRILPSTNVKMLNTGVCIPERNSLPDNLETLVSYGPLVGGDVDALKNLRKLKHVTCVEPATSDRRAMEVLRRLLAKNTQTITDLTVRSVCSLETLKPIAQMPNLEYIHINFISLRFITSFAADAIALIPAKIRKIILSVFEIPIDVEMLRVLPNYNDYENGQTMVQYCRNAFQDFMKSFDRFQDSLEALALQKPLCDLVPELYTETGFCHFLEDRIGRFMLARQNLVTSNCVSDSGEDVQRAFHGAANKLPVLTLYGAKDLWKSITSESIECRFGQIIRNAGLVDLVCEDELLCKELTI